MQGQSKQRETGIVVRHSRGCPSLQDGKCSAGRKDGCRLGYEARVYDRRSGRTLTKVKPTRADARRWRAKALTEIESGRLAPSPRLTLRQAAQVWLAGAQAGAIKERGGAPYK